MKKSVLITSILCLLSSLVISQVSVDVSGGFSHVPSNIYRGSVNGLYISAAPSTDLNNKVRLRANVQYRKIINKNYGDNGIIELSPEVEYEIFNFLSVGGGAYYSFNFTSFRYFNFRPISDIGLVGLLRFKIKNAYVSVRYSKTMVDEIRNILDTNASMTPRSFSRGIFHFGLGYTFGKR